MNQKVVKYVIATKSKDEDFWPSWRNKLFPTSQLEIPSEFSREVFNLRKTKVLYSFRGLNIFISISM